MQRPDLAMPKLTIPNDASIHTLKNFLVTNSPFCDTESPARLVMNPKWAYMDPVTIAMAAAWGGWCARKGCKIAGENIHGKHANYPERMKLFELLGIPRVEILGQHEESGRFIPLRQVRSGHDLAAVIGDVSALLHLDKEPAGLNAVQYCVSELVRNVLEHSGSIEGAYVCAQRYTGTEPKRVTIAVADCGFGIAEHLSRAYPEARGNDQIALQLAMKLGVTGAALSGMYGATENAGAGLFFTRAIAKATGGYFVLISGNGVFRQRRLTKNEKPLIFHDAFGDPRHDFWNLNWAWPGTIAAVEIVTEKISDYPGFFKNIWKQLPAKKTAAGKIKFTS